MILKRYLTQRDFDPAAPLCEIETDGVTKVLLGHHRRFGAEDWGTIYYSYVAEGCEVGPTGALFESRDIPSGDVRAQGPIPLHAKAKMKLTRRDRYPKIFLNYRRDDADAYAGRLHEFSRKSSAKTRCFWRSSASGRVRSGTGLSNRLWFMRS